MKAKEIVAALFEKFPDMGEISMGHGRASRWLDGKDEEKFRIPR